MKPIYCILLLALSCTALADNYQAYIGTAVSTNKWNDDHYFNPLKFDDRAFGMKIYGGWQFDGPMNIELSTPLLGGFKANNSDITIHNDISGLLLSILGRVSIGNDFYLFGQAGTGAIWLFQDINYTDNSDVAISSEKSSVGSTVMVGIGLSYTPARWPMIAVRLAWEHYWFQLETITVNSGQEREESVKQRMNTQYLGIAYRF
jgi:hypothetical protein